MRILFILLFTILLTAHGRAQTPGYMGKRFQAGYGLYVGPALRGSTANGRTIFGDGGNAESGSFAFNTTHEAYIEYALTKIIMAGFSVRYYKTAYDNAARIGYTQPNNYYNYNYYSNNYDFSTTGPKGSYSITGLNYSVYFKIYFRNFSAPWGRYFIFGPTLRTYTAKLDTTAMKASITDYSYSGKTLTYTPLYGDTKQHFTTFDFLLGFGRNRILYDHVSLDYGFNVNAVAFLYALSDVSGARSSTAGQLGITEISYIETTAKWRTRGVNRLNAFLKIGYIF
ncbi:MAG: hypothetical protein JST26_08585 [Bacteroidetes bacterium]|nr:hypothetical protein [Bacteroidota bacterium]